MPKSVELSFHWMMAKVASSARPTTFARVRVASVTASSAEASAFGFAPFAVTASAFAAAAAR